MARPVFAVLSGSERPQSAAEFTMTRSSPMRCMMCDDALLVHLGVGVDREAHPGAAVGDRVDAGLVEVVDEHALHRDAGLGHHVERAPGAHGLVAMRGVDEHGEVELDAEREVLAQDLVFFGVIES